MLAGPVVIVPDERTNSLLIHATQADYDVLKAAVDQLDIRPLQVLIEVLIVETERNSDFGFGASFTLPPQGFNHTSGTIDASTTGASLGDFVLHLLNVGHAQVSAAISAAASRGDVKIVSRPVLLASNNTEASIMVGSHGSRQGAGGSRAPRRGVSARRVLRAAQRRGLGGVGRRDRALRQRSRGVHRGHEPARLDRSCGRGVLFLDEAGDLARPVRAKLLRVLDDGVVRRVGSVSPVAVRTRLVVAVQVAPRNLVTLGQWREDFYYRVAGILLRVPALKERRDDIAALARHCVARRGLPPLDSEALALLEAQPWPGNVRDLERTLVRAAHRAGNGPLTATDVQAALDAAGELAQAAAATAPLAVEAASTEREGRGVAAADSVGAVARAAALVIGAVALKVGAVRVWEQVFGAPAETRAVVTTLGASPWSTAQGAEWLLVAVILIPIVEESNFRRHLFDIALTLGGRLVAVMASSIGFASVHLIAGGGWGTAGEALMAETIASLLRLRSNGVAIPTYLPGEGNGRDREDGFGGRADGPADRAYALSVV